MEFAQYGNEELVIEFKLDTNYPVIELDYKRNFLRIEVDDATLIVGYIEYNNISYESFIDDNVKVNFGFRWIGSPIFLDICGAD